MAGPATIRITNNTGHPVDVIVDLAKLIRLFVFDGEKRIEVPMICQRCKLETSSDKLAGGMCGPCVREHNRQFRVEGEHTPFFAVDVKDAFDACEGKNPVDVGWTIGSVPSTPPRAMPKFWYAVGEGKNREEFGAETAAELLKLMRVIQGDAVDVVQPFLPKTPPE